MFKPVTIKDIAIALSVSPSTVSRALRDSYEVGEGTKKLVKAYATKVNYHSNPIALSLKNKRSYSIGVMVAAVIFLYGARAIRHRQGIRQELVYAEIPPE